MSDDIDAARALLRSKAAWLIQKHIDNIEGKKMLTSGQLNSVNTLLNKVLPDLKTLEHTSGGMTLVQMLDQMRERERLVLDVTPAITHNA